MSSACFDSKNILKTILQVLSTDILDVHGDSNVTEEDIYDRAFILRNNGKIPFFPRSIGRSEVYSNDICNCIEILISLGFLIQVDHQDTCGKIFSVSDRFRDGKDITKMLYRERYIESLATNLRNKPLKHEKNICSAYFEFLKTTDDYIFTHLGSLSRKSANIDLEQVGIENFKILASSEPKKNMRKRGYEEKILSKLGRSILSKYNDLFFYNFRFSSLREAYEKESENIKGKLVLIIGLFEDEYDKRSVNYVYKFRDSVIFDENHKIRVLFGEEGKFYCSNSALSDMECLLLGFVEPMSGEVALRAAGVIKIGVKYGSVPYVTYSKRPIQGAEQSAIIGMVREPNGTKTPVRKSSATKTRVVG